MHSETLLAQWRGWWPAWLADWRAVPGEAQVALALLLAVSLLCALHFHRTRYGI